MKEPTINQYPVVLQYLKKELPHFIEKDFYFEDEENDKRTYLLQVEGECLAKMRNLENLSRYQLACYTEVSESTIKRAEQGKASIENVNHLMQFFLERNGVCKYPRYMLTMLLAKIIEVLPPDAELFKDSQLFQRLAKDLMEALTLPTHCTDKEKCFWRDICTKKKSF